MVMRYQVTKRRSDIRENTVNHEEEGIISGKITVNQKGQWGIYLGLICQLFRE